MFFSLSIVFNILTMQFDLVDLHLLKWVSHHLARAYKTIFFIGIVLFLVIFLIYFLNIYSKNKKVVILKNTNKKKIIKYGPICFYFFLYFSINKFLNDKKTHKKQNKKWELNRPYNLKNLNVTPFQFNIFNGWFDK